MCAWGGRCIQGGWVCIQGRGWADPPGHVTCDACWEAKPPSGQTNTTCENITLPQTSFAAGKYIHFQIKPALDILLELFFEEQDA